RRARDRVGARRVRGRRQRARRDEGPDAHRRSAAHRGPHVLRRPGGRPAGGRRMRTSGLAVVWAFAAVVATTGCEESFDDAGTGGGGASATGGAPGPQAGGGAGDASVGTGTDLGDEGTSLDVPVPPGERVYVD